MRIVVDRSCFLETSTHLQETKLKIVVLLSRLERGKTLGEIVNSQLFIGVANGTGRILTAKNHATTLQN
jgi:hypothetical protein